MRSRKKRHGTFATKKDFFYCVFLCFHQRRTSFVAKKLFLFLYSFSFLFFVCFAFLVLRSKAGGIAKVDS